MINTFEFIVKSLMILFDPEFYLFPLVMFAFMILLYIVRNMRKWL